MTTSPVGLTYWQYHSNIVQLITSQIYINYLHCGSKVDNKSC